MTGSLARLVPGPGTWTGSTVGSGASEGARRPRRRDQADCLGLEVAELRRFQEQVVGRHRALEHAPASRSMTTETGQPGSGRKELATVISKEPGSVIWMVMPIRPSRSSEGDVVERPSSSGFDL